jgi:PAS domain S-box-containing protein
VLETGTREPQSWLPAQSAGSPRGALPLIARAGSVTAGLVGVVMLVGWLTGHSVITNWRPDLAAIKPVTALAILLIASAVVPPLPLAPRWRTAMSVVAALLGASSLIQELGGVDLRIEPWSVPTGTGRGLSSFDFRMPPATALAVLAAGTGTALLPLSQLTDAARFLTAGIGVIGAAALLGYLLGVDVLYSFHTSVALLTALSLTAICATVLIHRRSSPASGGDFRLFLSHFFVPLLLFALFGLWSWGEVEADARASASRAAASLSEYAQRVFEIQETGLDAVLNYVNGRSAADIAADRTVHKFLSQMEKPSPTSDAIILVRPGTGRVISSSRGFPTADADVSQSDYFKAHRNGYQGTYIGEVINTLPLGGIGFTISRHDPTTGIIAVAEMSINSFMRLADLQASPRDALALARTDGMALVFNPPPADPVGFRLPEDSVSLRLIHGEARAGIIASSGVDRVERLLQFRKVGDYPVYAIYGLDVSLVHAAWLRHIVPFGLVTLLASVLTFGMSRRWQIAVDNRRRAENEAQVARVRAERAETLAEIQQAHDDLVQLIERSNDFIATADLDGRITYMNSAARRMIGRDPERDRSDLHFSEYIAAESLGYFEDTFIPAVRQHGHASAEMKLRNLTSGELIDVICATFLLLDQKGNPNQLATVTRDITDRKRHEEHLDLLVREVNHRAKNMLSVVQAISHQTAAKSPKDFITRFAERLQALSANQDLLVQSDWGSVDVDDLVHAQLAHFSEFIGSRIFLHGPKLRLNPASAQAMGLAIHELATNAGKYGALSTDTGRVDFSWGLDRDTFTMSWTERYGPPVSPPERQGFGTIVMKEMVERSIGGAVDLCYLPSGMTWRLTCPAVSLLDPKRDAAKFGRIENRK